MARLFPTLLILVLLSTAGASVPSALQDDAGSGRDAPDEPVAEVHAAPGVVHEGIFGGADLGDHYAFSAQAGQFLQFRLTTPGCFEFVGPDGAHSRSTCYLNPGSESITGHALDLTGTWLLHVYPLTAEPLPYRFSFALDGDAPSVRIVSGQQRDPLELPPVAPASQDADPIVIAVVDTGINPYHEFFRAPALDDHPSTWLDGFPAEATSLPLTLSSGTVVDARAADDAPVWARIERSAYDPASDSFHAPLYTFPGTRIVGAVSFGEYGPIGPDEDIYTPVWDDHGHGTHSAGLAAGADLGAADGNVLIVVVEVGQAQFNQGILWAARQPWIDALSLSIGTLANVPYPETFTDLAVGADDATHEAWASGKVVFVASGNGIIPFFTPPVRCATYLSEYTGPSWVTRVGAAEGDASSNWHCAPVSAVARTNRAAPEVTSMKGATHAGGTSAATPNLAAHWAHLVLAARAAGLEVSHHEALEHLLRAADPLADEPQAAPSEAYAPIRGYGLVEEGDIAEALATLEAGAPTPRPDVEAWFAADAAARDRIWGPGRLSDGPGVG